MDSKTFTLSKDEMIAALDRVSEMILKHFTDLREKPVTRQKTRRELERIIDNRFPAEGVPIADMLSVIESQVMSNIMHPDHPRFFAFVPSPGNFVSVLADALVSAFNVFNGTWMEASSAAKIELTVLDWFREALGLPESAGGLFVSGGSIANMTAMCAARDHRLANSTADGIAYYSDQTHSSIGRGLHIVGIPQKNQRTIPTGETFEIDVQALTRQIELDIQAGKTPFLIVASAGTTNTGAVDPFGALRPIADQYGMWLHIDGAYGAAAAFCQSESGVLDDIGLADSVSIDPHKWLFQPYEAAVLVVKDRRHLLDTYRVLPEYLQDVKGSGEQPNFCDYGPQLTRSFKALKVWLSFSVFGRKGLSDAISKGFELARYAHRIIDQSEDLHLVTKAQMAIVCFRYGKDAHMQAAIAARVVSAGYAMVATTILNGRPVLRLCTINPRTTASDIKHTLDLIVETGARLKSEPDAG
jgi:glutamate/tyrosine decarboxylase-like PLP-dependent enzyme